MSGSDVRVMTYNLLNFSDDDNREMHYMSIIESVLPDLIVVQEVVGQTGFTHFQSDVLDVFQNGQWSSAPFINQSAQQDIALFFKHDIFSFVSTGAVATAQSSGTRDVIEWSMVHDMSEIEFNIYGVHFKASSGSSNAQQRLAEATILRQHLNSLSGSYFIVAGDFNIYSNSASTEPAFNMLTGESDNNGGRLFDPIDRIGNWHNNSLFSDVHTQSPRTTSFGGGANGGMDDRFDWLFVSESILNDQSRMVYIDDSYTAFGNDGNHFNDAINSGNNFSVSDQIADALHDASDHLPVYMDIWFDDLVFTDRGVVITEIMANPASVSDSYGEWFEITNTTDTTILLDGWSIKDNGSDMHLIQIENQDVAIDPGQFFVFARNGTLSSNGGVVSNYVYSGFSLSNTEDEIILMDSGGAVVDEVQYESEWNFPSGISKEIHDVDSDNNLVENWFVSTIPYGSGDYGTPGYSFEGSLGSEYQSITPDQFIVHSLFPNPFNSFTTIRIFSEEEQAVTIQTFDLFGRELERENNIFIQPGFTELQWEGKDYPSSIYFLKISSSSSFYHKKLILLK
ncbi:MAG: lamin tail domain-containing protein [Candidatus Neomarinimicrobiota bacterium]